MLKAQFNKVLSCLWKIPQGKTNKSVISKSAKENCNAYERIEGHVLYNFSAGER